VTDANVEREEQRRIVEAVILASSDPIPAARIAALLPRCNPSQVRALIKELNDEYAEQRRAFEIWEVAGGYQLRSLAEFAPYLKQIQTTRPLRLSQAALETLAIVAYRQPATRAEIEDIRGVDAGAVLRSLLERNLLRIAGHREVPGRPILYATTRRFLEVFGLAKLGDLPTLREVSELASDAEMEQDSDAIDGASAARQDAGAADAADTAESDAEPTAERTCSREEIPAPLGAPPPPSSTS